MNTDQLCERFIGWRTTSDHDRLVAVCFNILI